MSNCYPMLMAVLVAIPFIVMLVALVMFGKIVKQKKEADWQLEMNLKTCTRNAGLRVELATANRKLAAMTAKAEAKMSWAEVQSCTSEWIERAAKHLREACVDSRGFNLAIWGRWLRYVQHQVEEERARD